MNLHNVQLDTGKRISIKAYGVFALGVVPVWTILFACQGDLIEMSLSRLGNRPGCYGRFVLWGVVCTGCLLMLFHRAFEVAGYTSAIGKGLTVVACASFLTCVLLPFLPDKYPRSAKWHNELAFLAAILTVVVSLLLSLHLRKVNARVGKLAMVQWAMNFAICFYLLKTTGVTSLLEALYIILTTLHTYGVIARLSAHDARPA